MNAPRHVKAEQSGTERICASRAELEKLLVGDPDSEFPRSHTMRMLRSSGPMWIAGIALGLMVVKPRWGARLMRVVPLARVFKRFPV